MFEFIADNVATIVTCAVLILIVAAIIIKLVRDKKHHRSSCSCGCGSCPNSEFCHKDR